MPASIIEDSYEQRQTITDDGQELSLQPRRLVYSGRDYAGNEDMLAHTGIPQRGSSIRIGDYWYFLQSRQWAQHTPVTGEVVCVYSTRPPHRGTSTLAKPFSFGYKRVTEQIPVLHLTTELVAQNGDESGIGGGLIDRTRWELTYIPVDIEQQVLTTTVYRNGGFTMGGIGNGNFDNQQSVADIKAFKRQIGHAHKFPRLDPEDVWILQPPQMSQIEINKYQISYMWLSDPGVGGLHIADPKIKVPMARPAWTRYLVVPDGRTGTVAEPPTPPAFKLVTAMGPYIYTYNEDGTVATQASNPLWTPDGWTLLPGDPFGG